MDAVLSIEIKVLRPGDEGVLGNVGPQVFDHAVDPKATKEFLADSRHHLVVAIENGLVVGFASGVHYLHPDKPRPELWINQVGVAATHRERGIGKVILAALFRVGRELGCNHAWVLTDRANPAAMRLYASVGGVASSPDQVMFSFRPD